LRGTFFTPPKFFTFPAKNLLKQKKTHIDFIRSIHSLHMTTHSLHAMRVSLLLLLGASIFSVSFAEELCTDGICVSDDGDEQSPPVTTEQYTVAVNSDGSTPNSAGNSPSFTADDFWESIDDVDNVLKKQKNTINPKKDAREILNQLKEKNSERKQDKTNTNNNAAKNPVEITPEMERYFQDLIESGGDHARLSVLSDLLSGTKSSVPVENMPTIILTDKETADEHLRKTWHAGNEEAMKREHIQEAASIDRLRAVFENTLSSTKEGNISDATTAVNMANMIEELFGVEENEFDGDDGMSDHTQMGFGIERNPCPNFEDSGKTGFLVPRMLHGYVDKNGEVMPEENTYQLSANGCSSLGEDSKDKDDFGLWKCCNRHSMCYGLCGSSLRFCERSYSTCMASTCDAIDIGHDEASIIANQEACRQKKKVSLFSFLFYKPFVTQFIPSHLPSSLSLSLSPRPPPSSLLPLPSSLSILFFFSPASSWFFSYIWFRNAFNSTRGCVHLCRYGGRGGPSS
jgi:hypothetical protein